jgi:outer membrane protein assembly factor BamB
MSASFNYRFFSNLLAVMVLTAGCSQSPKLDVDASGLVNRPQSIAHEPQQAWEIRLQTPPSALIPLDSSYLLVTSHRGEVYTLDLVKGKRRSPIWQTFRKGITARLIDTPTQRLYLAAAQEELLRAYNLERGKLAWKHKTTGVIGPMALIGDHLLAASLTGKITAHESGSGRVIWERKLPGRIQHGIQIVDSLAMVLTDRGTLYAFASGDANNSTQAKEPYPYLWKRDLPVNPNAYYAADKDYLYIVDSQGQLICINAADGGDVFRTDLGALVYTPPLVIPGLVLVATAEGNVIALSDKDGSQVWQLQGSGLINHPLLSAETSSGRQVLTVFARGDLLALDAFTGEELWWLETGNPIEIAALTADGVLVVNRRNRLRYYCFKCQGEQH